MKRNAVWALIASVVVVLAYFAVQAGRSDYLEFDRQREAWHRRCDVYVGKVTRNDPEAVACQRELEELTAYAKRKGW